MFSSQNVLKVLFIILLIVILSEVYYLFVYQPANTTKIPEKTVTLPTPVQPTPKSINQVKDFIDQAKAENQVFVSYYGTLKKLMTGSKDKCVSGTCFELSNSSSTEWISDVDRNSAISVSDSFVVKLHLSVDTDEASEISLSGRVAGVNQYDKWWRNPNIIFVSIGFGTRGKSMYLAARNKGSDPYLLYEHTFDKPVQDVYLLFDRAGKFITIADPEYNEIANLDVNEITGNKLPDGLFPDKKVYLGYGVSPKSSIVIYDLSILSLK